MTNSNRIKLTWISFLSYALTGALVIVTGMVMGMHKFSPAQNISDPVYPK